ncbi:uncharacterized protein LOC130966418 isoform X2 [Arachis stenosperma]|uniref:uncharacterized protein LOC130966418 isoform X2 n=1 Tax=Arachis stenosperma TaxID=217475 RepID=UPI0025ACE5AF|nr:uncharacterized protein LOC130966418 isoform X2 [Arachis stenosperma]
MEMRGADGGTSDMLCALPAFWVVLLHDEVSLHNALDMIVHWTPEERQNLRNMAARALANLAAHGDSNSNNAAVGQEASALEELVQLTRSPLSCNYQARSCWCPLEFVI